MKLSYEELGDNSDVCICFIHGWGLPSKVFYPIAQPLSEQFKVILIDLPGYGVNNDIPANRCNGILHSLEETIPNNSVVVGWSLGGILATKLSIVYPEKVKMLITIASSPKFTSDLSTNWRGVDETLLNSFISKLSDDNCLAIISKFLSLQAMGSQTLKNDIKQLKSILATVPTPKYYELLSGLKTLMDEDLRLSINKISAPSLHIYGEHDSLIPAPKKNYWITNNKSIIQIIPKCSHAPFISNGQVCLEIINNFIRENM